MDNGYKIENKVFYLDVKNAPKMENQAINYIRKYGGIVSRFLDSKVHYILHNGHVQQHQPVKPQEQQPLTPKKPLFGLSRSRKLLAASVQTAPMVPNPQEQPAHRKLQCKNLDIKDFIQYFTKISEEEARIARETAKASDPNSRRLKKLRGRFIKVSFNPQKYRAMYKEFLHWPELDLEFEREELCPFAPTQATNKAPPGVLNPGALQDELQELQQQQLQQSLHQSQPQLSPHPQQVSIHLHQQQSQQLQLQPHQLHLPLLQQYPHIASAVASNSRPMTPSNTAFSTALASKMTTPFASHSIKTLSRSRRSLNAQKKPGIYCEICGVEFDDYEQHMNDEKHIQYLKNNDNYQELVSLVQNLPNNYSMGQGLRESG